MATNVTLINQRTAAASRKVNGAGAAPIIAALVLGLLAMWKPQLYERLPAGFELQLGLALGGALAWVAGYMRKEAL